MCCFFLIQKSGERIGIWLGAINLDLDWQKRLHQGSEVFTSNECKKYFQETLQYQHQQYSWIDARQFQ